MQLDFNGSMPRNLMKEIDIKSADEEVKSLLADAAAFLV